MAEKILLLSALLGVGFLGTRLAALLRLPHSVFMVLFGLGVGVLLNSTHHPLGSDFWTTFPETVLYVLLPPLVFESAYHFNFDDLRRDLAAVIARVQPDIGDIERLLVGRDPAGDSAPVGDAHPQARLGVHVASDRAHDQIFVVAQQDRDDRVAEGVVNQVRDQPEQLLWSHELGQVPADLVDPLKLFRCAERLAGGVAAQPFNFAIETLQEPIQLYP